MTTIDTLNKFLEIQFQSWGQNNKERKNFKAGPVIAISRMPGCDIDLIARRIAEEFGLVIYDSAIVEAIARDAKVSEQMVSTLEDNYRSELDEWLDAFTLGAVMSNDQYLLSLKKVLFTVAAHGSAVILGRGANFLLPPEKRTLGLYLVAPFEMRTATIMQTLNLPREAAQKHITHMEQEQRRWVKKFGCADVNGATNYHLVVNTAIVTPGAILQIVKEILRAGGNHEERKHESEIPS